MDMHITGKNVELIPAVRDYISKKMNKIKATDSFHFMFPLIIYYKKNS